MENTLSRFPHLGVMIFDDLDVQGIKNCKKVNHSWRQFLDTEYKRHQIRAMKRTIKKFTQLDESWIEFFDKANSETIKSLGISMDNFSEKGLESKLDWSPDKIASFLKKNTPPSFHILYSEDVSAEEILDNWIGLDFEQGQFGIKFRTKRLREICIRLVSTEDLSFWSCGYEFIQIAKSERVHYRTFANPPLHSRE